MVRIIIALLFVFRLLPLHKLISNCPREPLNVLRKTVFPKQRNFASGFEAGTEECQKCVAFF